MKTGAWKWVLCAPAVFLLACSDSGSDMPDGSVTDLKAGDSKFLKEDTAALCNDGKDNDGDTFTDCTDQDCWVFDFCKNKDAGIPDAPRPDAKPVDGPLPDKPATPKLDMAKADMAKADSTVPDILPPDIQKPDSGMILPGCKTSCGKDEVCMKGKCQAVGPAKTCGASKYQTGLPGNTVYVDVS